ncbi:MAG: hypothetical protein LBH20_03700 [Treponema sp.]|nr:hypothetical protein [Treponema sp.]
MLYYGAAALGIFLAVFLTVFFTRPKLLWYVDENYSAAWNRILKDKAPPFQRSEVVSRQGNDSFPKGRFGFLISRSGPEGENVDDTPVMLYPDLSRTREYKGWMVLALDPWMVFRKHQDPEPGWSFLDSGNDRGSILLAGVEERAVQAWLCQLMQEKPGVFVSGNDLWKDRGSALARDYPFQNGALTYSWVQVWPLLFRSGTSSLYAPLSQARALRPYQSGLLDATRFPQPEDWNRYGLQADILWAKMHGDEKRRKKLTATEKWLKDPKIQTFIANTIEWIPAHPSGVPYNTISWETQMAWLRSSFIWQGVHNAQSF